MKKHTTIVVAALLTTTVFAGQVLAQATATSPAAASVPAGEAVAKDTPKDQAQEGPALSPEKAKMYNDAMQQAAEANKELHPQMHKVYEEIDAILTAEKFDKAAFLAKRAELDALYAKARAKQDEAYISVAEKLSQEDRKILVKARNERRHKNQ